jgi:pyruvate/2-oxoglutarate dehydrogenase complex dihydrolipoamide acyltransferase (E2) component
LHSATGSFEPNTPTRHTRTTSLSSSDSCLTARAYPVNQDPATSGAEDEEELQAPPTPETPEALRHIEEVILPSRMQHRRGLSAESLATIATFETAEEGHQVSIAQWLSRSTSASSIHDLKQQTKPSRSHPSNQAALPSPALPPTYTPASAQNGQQYISISPSATTIAVSALLDPTKGQGLGSKDEALVYTLVESLREVVGELQLGAGGEERRRWLRRRLDEARRVIEGEDLER